MIAQNPSFRLLVLALILPTVALAQAPAPESYLVRRTIHLDDQLTGFKYDLDFTIFRDGLVIGIQRFTGETFLLRARGTPEEVRQLQRTLSQNRFGAEQGRCNYRDQPGQGEVLESAVTWFGRNIGRQSTVHFGVTYPRACSDTFIQSIDAISTFFATAGNRPDAQFERVPADIFGTSAPSSLP